MNLHLLYDKKFTKGQIDLFEKHFPNQSLYVITRAGDVSSLMQYNIMQIEGISLSALRSIIRQCEETVENVFVYNATDAHCIIALYMKKRFKCKVYWMFFGSDLYDNLYYRYNYPLIDNERKTIKKYVLDNLKLVKHWPLFRSYASKVDYFCFWNIYDYELLKKYVNISARFKFYTHGEGLPVENKFMNYRTKSNECIVQVNHSASWDGNHLTVLKKIAEMDPERRLKLLIPLSYGSKSIIKEVEEYVTYERLNAQILLDFLPMDNYFTLMKKVNSAIYGQHRQEGGGNILQAFENGTKVFLREDNNLLQLYRDWGLKVFCFEKDLNCVDDLITPLSKEDQENNYIRIHQAMSCEKVEESMLHMLENSRND